jgi:hypothetical protein
MPCRYRTPLLLCLLLAGLSLAACRADPNEAYIEGIWSYEDPHLKTVVGEPHQTDTWLFERGKFQNSACCFGKAYLSGDYRVLESEENRIVLELFNIDGQQGSMPVPPDARLTIELELHPADDTLDIGPSGPYLRQTP